MNKRRSTSTAVSDPRTPERGGKEYLKEAAQLRLLSPSITLASPELRRKPSTREQLQKELTELGFPIDQYMSQTRTLSHMQVSTDPDDGVPRDTPTSQHLYDVDEHHENPEQGSNESLNPSEHPERGNEGAAEAPAAAAAAAHGPASDPIVPGPSTVRSAFPSGTVPVRASRPMGRRTGGAPSDPEGDPSDDDEEGDDGEDGDRDRDRTGRKAVKLKPLYSDDDLDTPEIRRRLARIMEPVTRGSGFNNQAARRKEISAHFTHVVEKFKKGNRGCSIVDWLRRVDDAVDYLQMNYTEKSQVVFQYLPDEVKHEYEEVHRNDLPFHIPGIC